MLFYHAVYSLFIPVQFVSHFLYICVAHLGTAARVIGCRLKPSNTAAECIWIKPGHQSQVQHPMGYTHTYTIFIGLEYLLTVSDVTLSY